ncbi:MAG: SdpI family protein [Monoglobales bacterium]
MIKKNIFKIILSFAVTLLPMVVGFILWDKLPDQMATNFDISGQAAGYSSKMFAVVGLPLILIACNLLCIGFTAADPKRKNIDGKVFGIILCIVPVCSLFCATLIYKDALGISLNVSKLASIYTGIVFVGIGLLLPKCKQNYTVGIKLPWTLHSEDNWNKTHAFGGKLWTIGGVLLTVAGLLGYSYITFIGIFVLAFVPIIYSYVYYRKNEFDK